METIIEKISTIVEDAFAQCGYDKKYGKAGISNRPDLCQFQCNGSLASAKEYHKAPIAIANEVCEKLMGNSAFSKVEALPP